MTTSEPIDYPSELEQLADTLRVTPADADMLRAAAHYIRRLRSYDFGRADRYAMIVRNLCGLIGITVDCSPHEAAEALKDRLASAPEGPPKPSPFDGHPSDWCGSDGYA